MSLNSTQLQWVKAAATAAGYSYAVLAALVDKESDGKFGWDVGGKKLPALNIEGHRFYKYLALFAPDKLKQAVADGLAAKKRGVVKVPGSYAGRYAMLERMVAVHKEAAYKSCSYGVGQIMGENAEAMGFPSAEALYANACYSGENQIKQIVKFIETKPPLVVAIHEQDVPGISFYYNGPQYKTNQYDTKLQALIDFYEGKGVDAGLLQNEDELRIKALGYEDVKSFQRENGLNTDGDIGQITRDKIAEVEKARKPKPPVKTIVATTTVAVAVPTTVVVSEGAKNITDLVKQVEPVIQTVKTLGSFGPTVVVVLVIAIVIGGIGYAIWKNTRKR